MNICDQPIDFLYDPGSMYTMIPRSVFDKLPAKPALININRTGLGVAQQKFKLDGVAYLNLVLEGIDSSFTLNYEPAIVSSDIRNVHFRYTFRKTI